MQLEETEKKKKIRHVTLSLISLSEMEFKIFQGFKNSEEKSVRLIDISVILDYPNYFLKIIVRKISSMKITIGIFKIKTNISKHQFLP